MACGIGQCPSEHGVVHEVWVEWALDLLGFAIREPNPCLPRGVKCVLVKRHSGDRTASKAHPGRP